MSKLSAVSAIIGLLSSLIFASVPALAAPPMGTLTGVTTAIVVGKSATVNTLTVTDMIGELMPGSMIIIRLPGGFPIKFDPLITMPAFGGTAAGKVFPEVTYSGVTMVHIFVMDFFVPGDTLTIDGLRLTDAAFVAAPEALEWSVDGGAMFAASGAAIEVVPNALAFVTVLPESSVVDSVGDLFIAFTTTNPIPADGSIEVHYPTNNDVTGGLAVCPGLDGGILLVGGMGIPLILTRVSEGENIPTEAPPGAYTCRIIGVKNISIPGDSGTFTVATRNADTSYLDTGEAPEIVFDSEGALTSIAAHFSPAYAAQGSTAVVSFTLDHPFPPTGIVAVDFPAVFDVSGANGAKCSSDDMTGEFATVIMGQTVRIHRLDADTFATAPMTCTIPGILNPAEIGPAGTLDLATLTSISYVIDSGISPEVAISAIPEEPTGFGHTLDKTPPGKVSNVAITNGGEGTSLNLTWTNPTNSDYSETVVYRSLNPGTLETVIAATKGTSFTDTGLITGQTYLYTFQPKDTVGNTQTDSTQYAATPLVGGTLAQGLFSGTSGATGAGTTGATPPQTPPSGVSPVSLADLTLTGSLVKGLGSAVYLVNNTGRHLFPNETTYFSWFEDFNDVQIVDDAILGGTPLVGNLTVRPGTYLVKSPTDAKVYAVEPKGTLRWIPNEDTASALYGSGWTARVATLPASLMTEDYTEGTALTASDMPVGTLLADATGYGLVTAPGFIQPVATTILAAGNFQTTFIVSVPTTLAFAVGAPITSPISTIAASF